MGMLLMMGLALPLVMNGTKAQVASGDAGSVVGVWKGESVCQIKDSPCRDEVSVYYVAKEGEAFHIKMNKVVDGKEQTMGTVDCKASAGGESLECRPNDFTTWTWKLDKDVLSGSMEYRGQLYRKIRLSRAG